MSAGGGVVKDPEIRRLVIEDLKFFFKKKGYQINQVVPSPISGPKGNIEYIIFLTFKKI